MKSYVHLIVLLIFSFQCFAQSYVGLEADNYAGVHGVAFNPSNVVGSPFRSDINVASVSSFGGSDYFGVDLPRLIESSFDIFESSFKITEDAVRFKRDSNNFFLNADVLGPSFMINLNEKSSIGLITRGRGFFNLNDFNGELFETILDDFESDDNIIFDSQNLNGTIHAWAEIGIAYGRILINKPNHLLKGGVTFKLLQGGGALFADSPGLIGTYFRDTERLITAGQLNYGLTENFDGDNYNLKDLTAGVGVDIGFTYQWHKNPESTTDEVYLSENKVENDEDAGEVKKAPIFRNNYKLKLGVSITDIGSIRYKNAERTSYDITGNVDTSNYEELVEFLEDNYDFTRRIEDVNISLPTALRVLVDYRITGKWLLSANTVFSLVERNNELANSVNNQLTLTPRYESKWLSFFVPVGIRQFDDVAVGGGFRFGPLSVGSGSIFTNLISDESTTADVFVALKVPLYSK